MKRFVKGQIIKLGILGIALLCAFMFVSSFISAVASSFSFLDGASKEAEYGSSMIPGFSDRTNQLKKLVDQECKKNGIPEYAINILAMIEVLNESGNDVMRSGGSTVEESVSLGVKKFSALLEYSTSSGPEDQAHLLIAYQAYVMGEGFISFAQASGGYSYAAAEAFKQSFPEYSEAPSGFAEQVDQHVRMYEETSKNFVHPLTGSPRITCEFGYRMIEYNGKPIYNFHNGTDFSAGIGTEIHAAASGKVVFSQYTNEDYGNYVIIEHTAVYSSLYAHCSQLIVSEGDIVKQGDVIALSGNSGWSTGPHLHFGIQENGEWVDPMNFLN